MKGFDEKKIDAIFSQVDRCHGPGAAVGIALSRRPVYRKGFGLASVELPVVLSPTIRMRIASVTKHFTALAYALLCEEGRAGIDDRVANHLPELHPVSHQVTLRQLMGHVSGLRDVCDICWQFSGTGHPVSSAEMLALYRDIDDANAAPGTTWNYNNGGYVMLTAAIERITGQSLEDVLHERIFGPAGMHDTLLRRFDTDFVANSATLHTMSSSGELEKSYAGTANAGEGGVVSTVDDMLRWLAHMDAPVVGSAATWRMMVEPHVLANGTSTGYGLGLTIGEYRGVRTISHSGSVMGGSSRMIKVPSAGLDVVILANGGPESSTVLANRVIDACLEGLAPVDDLPRRPCVTRTFHSPKTGRVIQLFAREGQQVVSVDGFDTPFLFDDRGVLHPAPESSFLRQTVTVIGDAARPDSIRFNDFGSVDELLAVEPIRSADASRICGTYRSDTTGTQLTIALNADGPRLTTRGRFGSAAFRLEGLAEGIWRARSTTSMPWGGIVSVDRDGESIRFTSPRTRALAFRRA